MVVEVDFLGSCLGQLARIKLEITFFMVFRSL